MNDIKIVGVDYFKAGFLKRLFILKAFLPIEILVMIFIWIIMVFNLFNKKIRGEFE